MAKINLQKLCDEWVRRLRLCDWDVTVSWVRFQDIGGMYGRSCCSPSMKTATVEIATPESLPNDSGNTVTDIEVTLAHELIHVATNLAVTDLGVMGRIADGGCPSFEAFIEQTAQALVAAKRGLVRLPAGGGDGQQ